MSWEKCIGIEENTEIIDDDDVQSILNSTETVYRSLDLQRWQD